MLLRTTHRVVDEDNIEGTGSLVPRGHYSLLTYSCAEFDFSRVVTSMLNGVDLELVGADDRLPLRTRATDQATSWHRLFYDRFSHLRPLYEEFVRRVVAKLFREPFYYQAVPTFRAHLPGNMAVGEFHVDSTYGHPEAELQFLGPADEGVRHEFGMARKCARPGRLQQRGRPGWRGPRVRCDSPQPRKSSQRDGQNSSKFRLSLPASARPSRK